MLSSSREDFTGKWDICFTSRFTRPVVCCLSGRCDNSESSSAIILNCINEWLVAGFFAMVATLTGFSDSFALSLFPGMSHSTFHSCFSNYSQLPNPIPSFDSRWHLSLSQLLKSGVFPRILPIILKVRVKRTFLFGFLYKPYGGSWTVGVSIIYNCSLLTRSGDPCCDPLESC